MALPAIFIHMRLAFGVGIHYRLGARFARTEIRYQFRPAPV
jgi:cytochrome P450